jgi:hypothetical protein
MARKSVNTISEVDTIEEEDGKEGTFIAFKFEKDIDSGSALALSEHQPSIDKQASSVEEIADTFKVSTL